MRQVDIENLANDPSFEEPDRYIRFTLNGIPDDAPVTSTRFQSIWVWAQVVASVLTFKAPLSIIELSSPVRFTDQTGPLRVATWRVFSFRT
jgi:hypothetical protein